MPRMKIIWLSRKSKGKSPARWLDRRGFCQDLTVGSYAISPSRAGGLGGRGGDGPRIAAGGIGPCPFWNFISITCCKLLSRPILVAAEVRFLTLSGEMSQTTFTKT